MATDPVESIDAVVCIPTFRRPDGLARTLQSLLDQQGSVKFAIVVVENDAANPVGAQRARAILEAAGIMSHIVIEHQQGNCHAINRAFGEARQRFSGADYLLMIDDDEIADPHWLEHMVMTARRTGAGIVGGPVIRVFEGPASDSIRQHSLNSSISGATRQIPSIHGSGNCLIHREVFAQLDTPLFDTKFNFLGGGDMEFFVRCRKAGVSFWWCAEAIIHEFVAVDRISPSWLMRRSVRTGSINYMIDRKHAKTGLAVMLLQGKNIISLGLGVVRSLAILATTGKILTATHPLLMSFGRMTASLGFLPAPYKANAIATPRQRQTPLETSVPPLGE